VYASARSRVLSRFRIYSTTNTHTHAHNAHFLPFGKRLSFKNFWYSLFIFSYSFSSQPDSLLALFSRFILRTSSNSSSCEAVDKRFEVASLVIVFAVLEVRLPRSCEESGFCAMAFVQRCFCRSRSAARRISRSARFCARSRRFLRTREEVKANKRKEET